MTPIVWTVITLLLQCDSHSVDGDHPSSKYSVTPIVWMVITLLLQYDSHSVDGDHPSSTV